MPFDLDESFRPPRWLANPHLQSILPSLPLRRRALARLLRPVLAASRELLLDCGDGVRLQAFHSSPAATDARVAVILHGWEGSSDSAYVLSLAQQLFERGFEVFRLNLRDHGATHQLNRELFHSCRLPEVIGAVRRIQGLHPAKRLHLAGFSLGGNFMLRVAALADEAGLDIAKVVAVSPVLDPEATLEAMESGLATYHRYFVRKWSRSLVIKESAWPEDYELSDVLRLANLRAMTAELVRRYTQFASLGDYLRGYAIVGARLATLH
ncbi:MAG: YheT family hydrolase, partial [Steroidobacteraceae bacterium]